MTIDARLIKAGAPPTRRRMSRRMGLTLIALTVVAVISEIALLGAGASPPSSAESEPAAARPARVDAGISKEPYSPYVRADEPAMFARWGWAGVAKINRLRIAAAEKVARTGSCDRVETSDLDDGGSAATGKLKVFVDCANTQRFILTEADLRGPIISETQKGARWGRQDAIDVCTKAVQHRLNVPASLSRDLFGTSAFQAATTGRWVVDFDFHARTGLGIKVPASASCVLNTDGRPEIRIALK